MCGYSMLDIIYIVQRKKVNRLNTVNEPVLDARDEGGSEIGHFMFANPARGLKADRAFLRSPYFDMDGPYTLTFYSYVYTFLIDKDSSMAVDSLNVAHQKQVSEVNIGQL